MKSKIILGIAILLCLNTMGQTVDYFKQGISPQVALMNRFGDYPVDLSNGLVDISIPLYTIQTSNLSMPLQLKFHASGLRADEREGLFGIRWALAGGGHVSRIIKGYPDEYYPFNSQVNNPDYRPDFNTLFGTTSTLYKAGGKYNSRFTGLYRDTEHDVFSYCLPSGKSGKFILDGTTGYSMPYEPLNIYVSGTPKYTDISIIDDDGTTYRFGELRTLSDKTKIRYADANEDGFYTTWHLSTIISANKQDTIQIDYKKPTLRTDSWNKTLIISRDLHDNSAFQNYSGFKTVLYEVLGELLTENYFKQRDDRDKVDYSPYAISSIQFKGGKSKIGQIDFIFNDSAQQPYICEMIVRDKLNNLIKKVLFHLKKNLSGKLNLLDRVEFVDITNLNNSAKYVFDYYDYGSTPACGDLSANSDWWGYYSRNGGWFLSDNNIGVIYSDDSGNSKYTTRAIKAENCGYKQSDVEGMKIGMLKSIRYPTGGATQFHYKGNLEGSSLCGGLSIERIVNTQEDGTDEIRRFAYEGYAPEYLRSRESNLYIENEIEWYMLKDNSLHLHDVGYGRYIQHTYLNTFPNQYTEFHSNIVCYPTVTEYIESEQGISHGKIVYNYNIQTSYFSYFNSIDGYSDFIGYGNNAYKHGYVSPTDFWQGNNLAAKTIYRGSQKVKEHTYTYTPYRKRRMYDMPVFRYRHHNAFIQSGYGSSAQSELDMIYPDCVNRTFAYKNQEYSIGTDRLVREVETTYYDGSPTSTITKEFKYDSTYFLLSEEKTTNSDGNIITTKYKYPFNCSNFIEDVYEEMVSKNILSPVVEKETRNGNAYQTTVTNYSKWGTSFYPLNITYAKDGYTPIPQIVYHNYSSQGKPMYASKDDAVHVVYLWSYNHQYPVAAIRNATYVQVCDALGGENYVKELADTTMPNPSDLLKINNLRTALPMAMIATYTYQPLVGRLTETDPSGTTTHYVYGSFGRLKEIYIMEGREKKVLEQYNHYYRNQ